MTNNFHKKYETKLLAYVCMSPKGVSKPFFIPSGLAVDQEVYLEQCIKKCLEPFVNKHYPEVDTYSGLIWLVLITLIASRNT